MSSRADFRLIMGLEGGSQILMGLNQLLELSKKVVDFVKQTAEEVQKYRRAVEGHTVSVHDADNATAGQRRMMIG